MSENRDSCGIRERKKHSDVMNCVFVVRHVEFYITPLFNIKNIYRLY